MKNFGNENFIQRAKKLTTWVEEEEEKNKNFREYGGRKRFDNFDKSKARHFYFRVYL